MYMRTCIYVQVCVASSSGFNDRVEDLPIAEDAMLPVVRHDAVGEEERACRADPRAKWIRQTRHEMHRGR